MKKKIIIIDDHTILRQGLRLVLNKSDQFEVVADFDNENSLNHFLLNNAADIIILDIHLTGIDGIEIARQTKIKFPQIKIIMHSMLSEEYSVEESKRHGADGYVMKCSGYKTLETAINIIMAGGLYFPTQYL